MKRVLITGENSYIGTSVSNLLMQHPKEFEVETISVRGKKWENYDFSEYDSIFHVAGLAHRKETKELADEHIKINTDLPISVAKKAKSSGVKQFVFLSSMSVFGTSNQKITKDTPLIPETQYGKSKVLAEKALLELESDDFLVSILRPPMVYGYNCKGNYRTISKISKMIPVFPDINNKRSMIFIDNLCYFVQQIIKNGDRGIYHPQNKEYVKTSKMVKEIAGNAGKKVHLTKVFNPLIKLIPLKILNKIFGDLYYDEKLSEYNFDYNFIDFNETIFLSEKE